MLLLTVLGDKGNAAVHNDGDAVFGQLLVAEGLAVRAGSQLDGRLPQRKVRLVEAVDVNRSAMKQGNYKPSDNMVSFKKFKETKVVHVFLKNKANTAKSLNKQPTRLKESKSAPTSPNKHRLPTRFDQKHTNQKQLMV